MHMFIILITYFKTLSRIRNVVGKMNMYEITCNMIAMGLPLLMKHQNLQVTTHLGE